MDMPMSYRAPSLDIVLTTMKSQQSMASSIPGNFPLNEAVLKALPARHSAISADVHGVCNVWFATGCICTRTTSGALVKFFIKYAAGEMGRAQIEAEFESMTRLYSYLPCNVPEPYAWGQLDLGSPTTGWFYLSEFVDFRSNSLPDPVETGNCIARLHMLSRCTESRYGFQIPTFDGVFCHGIGWEANWTSCFARLLCNAFAHDRTTNGAWAELELAMARVQQYVIPRLLGALENEGRQIQPCFIHGDLWEGNFGADVNTGKLIIFDSNGYYAHHEMELGMWLVDHHKMTSSKYRSEYLQHIEPSEPVVEFDDRIRLYSVKNYLMYSAHCRGHYVRKRAFEELMYLIRKYPPEDINHEGSVMASSRMKDLIEEKRAEEISTIIAFTTREEERAGACGS